MNLYKILFSHTAPKDSEKGVKCLLLAENDEQVYEWIKKNTFEGGVHNCFTNWSDRETDNKEWDVRNSNWDITGKENFKERIIRLHGEMFDDEYDYSDAYYGITLYGWELLVESPTFDIQELEKAAFLHNA